MNNDTDSDPLTSYFESLKEVRHARFILTGYLVLTYDMEPERAKAVVGSIIDKEKIMNFITTLNVAAERALDMH